MCERVFAEPALDAALSTHIREHTHIRIHACIYAYNRRVCERVFAEPALDAGLFTHTYIHIHAYIRIHA